MQYHMRYHGCMGSAVPDIIARMRRFPANVRFSDLAKVCDHYFKQRHTTGSSHRTYKTPWPGNPRVNIQNAHGKAKPYQVAQVLAAIDKLTTQHSERA